MTTTSSSSKEFFEKFFGYDFQKRPSITDNIATPDNITKNSPMIREEDAGLTKREIRRETI